MSRNFPINCCDGGPGGPGGPIIRFGGGKNGGVLQYMNVYPNPTSGVLVVELYDEFFEEMEEKIIDISSIERGHIYQESFYNNRIEIDLNNQQNGQYFLTVSTPQFLLGNSIVLTK